MPYGKDTYGKKRGRPPKKKNKTKNLIFITYKVINESL